jgi:lipopolysaccharide exporter
MQSDNTASISEQVVSSTLWMGSWRWSARLIGFATTVVLARLLLPEDFGIVATGAIIVGFFTIMLDLGTDKYLIRHKNPDRDDYDTAWSLRFIVITVASMAIFFAAQAGANYFGDQRLVNVVRLLAVAGWLNGFTNIGLTMYRRELQFRIIALIGLSQRLAATVTIIALAVWLRSYWAMIIGEMVFMLVGLVLSYTQHEYRPRFTLLRARKQWEFCKWILLQNLAAFMQGRGDSFVVVKFFGIELMGIYSMAMRIAALPTRQVIMPVLPPVYSGLAKKQHDPDIFVASALKVIGATASLMLPAATLFAVLNEELITVVLGERWMLAIPIVTALIFSVLLAVLTNPAATVLTIKGKVKLLAGLNWLSAVMVVVVLLMVAQWYDIETLVWARTAVTFILLLLYYLMMMLAINVSALTLIGCIYRPFFASLVMALVIYLVASMVGSAWLVIFAGIMLGGATYLIVAAVLWRLAGSPDSGEAILVRKLGKIIKRKLKKPG